MHHRETPLLWRPLGGLGQISCLVIPIAAITTNHVRADHTVDILDLQSKVSLFHNGSMKAVSRIIKIPLLQRVVFIAACRNQHIRPHLTRSVGDLQTAILIPTQATKLIETVELAD